MFLGIGATLQSLLRAEPFVPFEIWMDGQTALVVHKREHAKMMDDVGSSLALYDPIKDRTSFVNLFAVEHVRIRGNRLNDI